MFHVGQEVVCISTEEHPRLHEVGKKHNISFVGDLNGLEKGKHYTVAALQWDGIFNEEIVVIAEIKRPLVYLGKRVSYHPTGYAAWRFRPVQKRSTDISSLVALLNPLNHKKLEEV